MFDTDISKCGEHHVILQEYSDVAEELKRELEICKTEQNNIRSELQTLHLDSKGSSDAMKDYISRIHLEECGSEDLHNKMVTNLKERIAVLQMEKESAVQLWQVSMKAVDALEQELKTRPTDGRDVKFYEEQLKDVKQSYSEAIKALETKLLQAKENFAKQQNLWATSKETVDSLKHEKQEMAKRLEEFQQDARQRDRNSQQRIQSLTEELSAAKAEAQRLNLSKSDLEKQLNESRRVASGIKARNEQMAFKMAETLDLIETAVTEKEIALQRKAQVLEEKAKLEARLALVDEEHVAQMQREIAKLKDAHEHSVKKYLLEIKELKSELRDKVTLLDRSQRESRLAVEELERVRRESEDLLEKSAAKILNLEQTLKHADSKLETCNEMCGQQYRSEMQQLREKIVSLEEKLTVSADRLRQIQQQSPARDPVRSVDERTRDAIDRYVSLESQLIQAKDDKESLATELKSLRSAFDREICKRDCERRALENKIHELQENLQKSSCAMESKLSANASPIQASSQRNADTINKHTLDIRVENADRNCQSLLSEQLNKQKEHFDMKIKEMTQHVTVHQKLSRRWREEAKSLTTRFQVKSKELRGKISSLRKENADLQKALLMYRQQYNQYRTDVAHGYTVQGSETR